MIFITSTLEPSVASLVMIAAYAVGFNILRNANIGKQKHDHDAETTPLGNLEF